MSQVVTVTPQGITITVSERVTVKNYGGGGPIALNDLTDVDISGAATGQVLTRASNGTWTAQNPTGGGSTVVENVLTSTSATNALSANQGRVLKGLFDSAPTQAWVTAQINALIDAAPGALDTLNELAAAIGDDPNFATTVTNAIAAKENSANKATNFTTVNDVRFPTVKAVVDYVAEQMSGGGAGDMMKATYDPNNNGVVNDAENLGGNSPAYYLTRTNHTGNMPAANVTETSTKRFVTDAQVTGWDSKAAGSHTHAMADVTGLVAALAGKATPADITAAIDALIASAPGTLDTLNEIAAALGDDPNFAATITALINAKEASSNKTANLTSPDDVKFPTTLAVANALAGKANTSHTHAIGDTSGLQAALDGKQDSLGFTPENVANKATDLTSPDNTKYPTTQAVANGLSGKQNTIGFTPENTANKSANLTSPDDTKFPTTLAVSTALAGKEPIIAAGTSGQFLSFNKTMAAVTKANVGLGNVDNTADSAKPISTAQQNALDLKLSITDYAPYVGTTLPSMTGYIDGKVFIINAT